jgi:hypothetical protein
MKTYIFHECLEARSRGSRRGIPGIRRHTANGSMDDGCGTASTEREEWTVAATVISFSSSVVSTPPPLGLFSSLVRGLAVSLLFRHDMDGSIRFRSIRFDGKEVSFTIQRRSSDEPVVFII